MIVCVLVTCFDIFPKCDRIIFLLMFAIYNKHFGEVCVFENL